jgi:hypothetical protein
MADEPQQPNTPQPSVTDRAAAQKREREERLRAALRTNLRRRNPSDYKISERPGMVDAGKKDQDKDG